MFEIVVEEEKKQSLGNVDESEMIREVYKIHAKNYQPVYSHIVSYNQEIKNVQRLCVKEMFLRRVRIFFCF